MVETPVRSRLSIKVVPSASRDGIAGWLGSALKIRVRSPAERGRANAEAERLLSAALGAPVRIVAGHGAPRKTVEIEGLSDADVRRRLAGPG